MWLTRVFLLRPTLVFVLVTLTFIAGTMALRSLVVQEEPNVGLPSVSISVAYNGASTTELQSEVAEPLEDQLAGTPYLQTLNTTIESGAVTIAAEFSLQSTDTENIANVERAVQAAQRQLPSTITPPTLRVANPSEPVVVVLGLVSKKYPENVLGAIANNTVVPALEQLPGVSSVNVAGTTQPAYLVTVDPDQLAADALTISDVIGAISGNNTRAPGGYVYQPGRETQLEVRGDLPTPQSVAQLPIHVTYTAGSSSGSATGGAGTTGATGATGGAGSAGGVAGAGGTSGATGNAGATAAGSGLARPNVAAALPDLATSAPLPAATAPAAAASPMIAGPFASGTSGSGTAGGGTTTSAVGSGTASAAASVPVDTPVTPQTLTNANAANAAQPTSVQPTVSSGVYGSGSGTSTSPFVGELAPWAIPSADKRVSDVAQVTASTLIPRISASQNGHPGVALLIQKQATASEVTVADEVLRDLPSFARQFPDVQFQVAHVQATFTEQQVQGVEHTLLEGIALTAIVMLFFLQSWRNAVVVMIAIPTSLGVTLFAMLLLGLTLDTISLMAMTLVIGILIDDSTVVLENIERHHRELGEPGPDAALNGRSEIGLAAIVITLVDVVVFLPIAFAGGEVGQFLHEFAIVITVSTLTSLFVSFTITPTLAGLWSMRSTWRPWRPIRWFNGRFDALRARYHERWLPWTFRFPWPVVIASFLLCALSLLLVPTGLVGEEFIPAEDQGVIYAQVTFPPGHPLAQTETAMSALEAATKQVVAPHDLQYETTIAGAYSAAFGGFVQEGNVGQISIYLSPSRATPTATYVARLQARYARVQPAALITVTAATQQGGGNQQQIDELVASTDNGDPTAEAAKVYAALRATPGATGAQDSAVNAAPQEEVEFNRPALQALDVSTGTATAAVQAAFGGDVVTQIETPTEGLTDIEVIYPHAAQTSLSDVMAIPLRSESGQIVHLGDVAYFRYSPAPLVITRENRQQVVHVTANVAPGYELSNVVAAFQRRVRALDLPPSVALRPAALGQQDLMNQAIVALLGSLFFSILLVFLMIVALYNSYRTPFVTLFAIPLATVGALGALWITHQSLNLFSLIGIVMLVGLVTKNGILLVDYADTVRVRDGRTREEGILESAHTRFRPIIMTTIAMVAGMTPLALGLEPGAASRASLAIVVIGGLLSSLFLTLFIVPIMYRWIAPAQLRAETHFTGGRTARPQSAS